MHSFANHQLQHSDFLVNTDLTDQRQLKLVFAFSMLHG